MGWKDKGGSGDGGDYDDEQTQVPVGYYWASLTGANVYQKDGDERLALSFEVETDDGDVAEVPFFLPAKVSHYDSGDLSDSMLVEQFDSIGLGEALFKALGKDGMEDGACFVPEDDDERNDLTTAIGAVLDGKEVKVDVNDLGDDASVVDKMAEYRDEE